MGMYLNQLPPTEVARLKAELAETLIANFCYPRFYDYRTNGLRMRPVDRGKRQEVWQYLNAVDFNVWGRVDVDSPDFPRQIEKLFILFVQRNRSFFGEQGRKRMTDVRTLISGCSLVLAEGLRGHLRGQQENPPFGSPRPVSSWSGAKGSRPVDLPWEQILSGTMQLQQQLQEARGEVRAPSAPLSSAATSSAQAPTSAARPGSVPARRPRTARPALATNGATSNGSGAHEDEAVMTWPPAGKGPLKSGEMPAPGTFTTTPKEAQPLRGELPPYATSADIAPTMPLPLGKAENAPAGFHSPISAEVSPSPQSRSRRGRPSEVSSAPSSGPLPRTTSQPLGAPAQSLQTVIGTDLTVKQPENTAVMTGDEDVVIFEQMRQQLLIWLRVEAVRSGIELNNQGAYQLAEALRHQDGIDTARLQVVSTLLNMCDQIIKSGRATLFDYKQAMMFYLMHTRRSR